MTERFGSNGKSLANLVMAIASYTDAKSTVEHSLSPLYNYQYSKRLSYKNLIDLKNWINSSNLSAKSSN